MSDGIQLLDLIILLGLAAFFIFQFRKVLGKHVDDGDTKNKKTRLSTNGRVIQLRDRQKVQKPAAPQPEDDLVMTDVHSPDVVKGLSAIKVADPAFNAKEFLSGARAAFEMILEAYAQGDKPQLKPLLSDDVYADFAEGIDENQNGDTSEDTTLVAIQSSEITQAALKDKTAEITVKFVSEQITVTRDREGNIVEGDPSATELVVDEWTFARDTRSQNPNWTLVGT